MWKKGKSAMLRKYRVHHKEDPNNFVDIRTAKNLTAGEAKEKAVKNGLFKRCHITELRVKRIK